MRCCLSLPLAALWMTVSLTVEAAPVVPADFVVENAVPGTTFTIPVSIAFFENGRMLVAEQAGLVWSVDNGVRHPTPLVDIRNEVLGAYDRGLLAVAIHPDFAANRFIYLLYTVDPDSNGTDTNDDAFGRLARYTISSADPNAIEPGSRAVLMGVTWALGPVSTSSTHTVGDLQWGEDGSLLVSVGDGAHPGSTDSGGQDAGAFAAGKTNPHEDIGSFRSQCLESLCGKILRLDPSTGLGYPSNPFYDGQPTSVASRIWAYGVRNPYRFTVRPGTGSPDPAAGDPGTIYLGDVGWSYFEEVSVAPAGGMNFGWPCFEGFGGQGYYQTATPARHGCGTIGTPGNPSLQSDPLLDFHHSNASLGTPPGYVGQCVTGGVFNPRSVYPPTYRNRYFYADYSSNWVRVAAVDANDDLTQVSSFGTSMDGPVDLETHPVSGDIHYVAVRTGEVRRVRYNGIVGVEDDPPVSGGLSAAFPTPTRDGVTFALDLARPGRVRWTIHDVQGRQIWRSPPLSCPAGRSMLAWSGKTALGRLPAGLYLARVEVEGRAFTRRIVRLR